VGSKDGVPADTDLYANDNRALKPRILCSLNGSSLVFNIFTQCFSVARLVFFCTPKAASASTLATLAASFSSRDPDFLWTAVVAIARGWLFKVCSVGWSDSNANELRRRANVYEAWLRTGFSAKRRS